MRTTLFVAGFGSRTRARDLAYEFERYGRLVRCDIPAPKNHSSKPYAFVEFEDPRDAEDSFNEMHGRRLDGYTISVQWARNAPSSSWRFERSPRRYRSPSPRDLPRYGRSRSRSPYGDRSPPPYPSGSGYYASRHPHREPSPLRGRSPPPPHHLHDRYYRSPPSFGRPYDDYPYPSSDRPSSPPPPPPPEYLSRSPSLQRRSISPRRSPSPE